MGTTPGNATDERLVAAVSARGCRWGPARPTAPVGRRGLVLVGYGSDGDAWSQIALFLITLFQQA
jgi:hypothetical protein